MNVRKRSGLMGEVSGGVPSNTVTTRKGGVTQAKSIKGAVNQPKAVGYSKIKGAITGPR